MRYQQKINQARALRKAETSAEKLLWNHLRRQSMNGRKFRRQATVGPFIADFLCEELSLIVELDGDVHALRQKQDERRSSQLEAHGYRVIRFPNTDVLMNLRGVLETLWEITRRDTD
jgi:very-short-patch-repair endonuclease